MIVESANMRNRQWLDNVNVCQVSTSYMTSTWTFICPALLDIGNMSAFAWLILTVVRNNSAPRLSAFKAFLWGSAGIDADDGSTILKVKFHHDKDAWFKLGYQSRIEIQSRKCRTLQSLAQPRPITSLGAISYL